MIEQMFDSRQPDLRLAGCGSLAHTGSNRTRSDEMKEPNADIQAEPAEVGIQPAGESAAQPEAGARRDALVTVSGIVRGQEVDLRNALVGAGARSIFAGGGLEIHQGGAGLIVAGGAASIRQGGAQAIVANGDVSMEQAGSGIAIGRRISIGPSGMTVLALAPSLEVHDGGKVIFGRSASLAILGGFAALAALLVGLLRGRR
jgi:hypothetical protein